MNESFSPDDRLRELLDYVGTYPRQKQFDAAGCKLHSDDPFEKIAYAKSALLAGALPNAKALAFIAYAFDKYISNEGTISLDEAFGLKSKPKAGNPSRQYARNNNRNSKLFDMAWLLVSNPRNTVDKAAHEVCKDDPDLSEAATLIRDYSRKNWAEIEPTIKRLIDAGK